MTRRTWRLRWAAACLLYLAAAHSALGGEWLPSTNLFESLIAAPKEPRFFIGVRQYNAPSVEDLAYAFAAGEVLPLYQFEDTPGGTRRQVAMDGGVIGLLDAESRSDALVNADYQIGTRIAWRHGRWSGRFRLYHQSSHLGDDYLVYRAVRYSEFTYESIEAIMAFGGEHWRLYTGGEHLFHRIPNRLDPSLARAGYELHGKSRFAGGAPFFAVDVRAWGEREWEPALSGLTGLEYDNHKSGRFVRLFVEGHTGYSPHGQFFVEDVNWLGVGIQFGL